MADRRSVIVAVRPFEYRGQPVTPDEVCVVEPAEAAALVYRNKARWPAQSEALGIYQRKDAIASTSPSSGRRRTRRTDTAVA